MLVSLFVCHRLGGEGQRVDDLLQRNVGGAEVDLSVVGHAEEQWQCLGGGDEEDAGTDDHHDLLLDNLSVIRKLLIHRYI